MDRPRRSKGDGADAESSMKPVLSLLLFGLAQSLFPQAPADRLDAVAGELEAIVDDLETAQAQTGDLRARLADLETLSAEHRSALADQDRLLAEYRASVSALDAHDRASLAWAQDLRGQLESERKLTGWLWPVAGVAVAVALVEGLALGWKR